MSVFRKEAVTAKQPRLHGSIILAQPLSSFLVTALISSFFVLGIFVAFTAEYARSEQAVGLLIPSNGLVKVFPRRPGVVTALNIQEGKYVYAGDLIAEVLVEESSRDGRSTETQSIDYLQGKLDLLTEKKALLERKASLDSIKIREERTSLSLALEGLSKRLQKQEEIVSLASSGFTRSKGLVDSGRVSRATYEERARSKLSAEQTFETLIQSRNELNSQLNLTTQKAVSNRLDQDLQINQLSAQILDIKQTIAELDGRRTYTLKAPVAGRATSVLASVGWEVSPQLPVVTIIPIGEELVAEIYISSRAVGSIKLGQEVRLRFEALSYQEFGYIPATVEAITSTILTPNEIDPAIQTDGPAYRLIAKLDLEHSRKHLDAVTLRPGMRLTAQIILEKLRFADHFFAPINAWMETL